MIVAVVANAILTRRNLGGISRDELAKPRGPECVEQRRGGARSDRPSSNPFREHRALRAGIWAGDGFHIHERANRPKEAAAGRRPARAPVPNASPAGQRPLPGRRLAKSRRRCPHPARSPPAGRRCVGSPPLDRRRAASARPSAASCWRVRGASLASCRMLVAVPQRNSTTCLHTARMPDRDDRIPILYLAPWVDLGGSDKGTIDWFKHLDRERFAPSLITTQPSSNRWLHHVEPFAEEVWALPELMPGAVVPRLHPRLHREPRRPGRPHHELRHRVRSDAGHDVPAPPAGDRPAVPRGGAGPIGVRPLRGRPLREPRRRVLRDEPPARRPRCSTTTSPRAGSTSSTPGWTPTRSSTRADGAVRRPAGPSPARPVAGPAGGAEGPDAHARGAPPPARARRRPHAPRRRRRPAWSPRSASARASSASTR